MAMSMTGMAQAQRPRLAAASAPHAHSTFASAGLATLGSSRASSVVAFRPRHHLIKLGKGRECRLSAVAAVAEAAVVAEDKWISSNLGALASEEAPAALQAARAAAQDALRTMRIPTQRAEEFRFTDFGNLFKETLVRADSGASPDVSGCVFAAAAKTRVVVVDGVVRSDLSSLEGLPKGAYVGPIGGAPAGAAGEAGRLIKARGNVFSTLAAASASDALVIAVPEGLRIDDPIHVVYWSTGAAGGVAVSSPMCVVHVGAGGSVQVVEEFAGGQEGVYFTNQVTEAVLGEGAELVHGYIQMQAEGAYHTKATLVDQTARSQYKLTEVAVGGGVTRHDIGCTQLGEETETEFHSFLLVGKGQLHDLHSKLVLDHPGGTADQLHKCIVAHPTGRGVFDGNVKVNRMAQQTDAGQLTRNLLLTPKATVNVKPNLQIIADDVACTHGCTVSDLEEEELFYFQSRGIDTATARRCLVNGFGLEIVNRMPWKDLRERVEAAVKDNLLNADFTA